MAGLYLPTDGDRLYEDDGTTWKGFGPLHKLTKPPLVSTWTWVNQGGATAVDNQDSIYLVVPPTAGSSTSIRGLFRSAPATPYVITVVCAPFLSGVATNQFGIAFRQSSDGKLATLQLGIQAANPQIYIAAAKYTNPTTYSASYSGLRQSIPSIPYPVFMRMADNGTNRILSMSVDGINWEVIYSVGRTDFLTADQVGFFADASNATFGPSGSLLSWEAT